MKKILVAVKPGGEYSKVNKRVSQEKKWRNIFLLFATITETFP